MFVNCILYEKQGICKRYLTALVADASTPSSISLRWDPVQVVKRGESVEYLLQSQSVGKDQDFVQVRKLSFLFATSMLRTYSCSWLCIKCLKSHGC